MKPSHLLALIASLAAASAHADDWTFDATHATGEVGFEAIGKPGFLKIHGHGAAPQGVLHVRDGKASGSLTFDLASLVTGISMRDEHMKDKYIEVGKYPQAKLTFSELAVPASILKGAAAEDGVPFKGTLSLHGTERPVDGTARLEAKNGSVTAAASFTIKTGEFGIPTPSYAGITLAETTQVSVIVTAPFQAESSSGTGAGK